MMPALPWEEKKRRIEERHPDALNMDWTTTVKGDPDLYARIIADVIKSSSGGSKPGKRPSLANGEAFNVYSKMVGDDFSNEPFHVAFNTLTGNLSLRGVKAKTGLGHTYISRLLAGEANPSMETIEKIAAGFKKDPSFFLEYRINVIQQSMETFLTSSPDTSISWFLKLRGKKK